MEQLLDPRRGPALLRRLSALLRARGVATVRDADVPCAWYRSLGRDRLERFQKYRYDFEDYTPGFTQPQIDAMAQRLAEFMREVTHDAELVRILKEYRLQVLRDTKVDRPSGASIDPVASG